MYTDEDLEEARSIYIAKIAQNLQLSVERVKGLTLRQIATIIEKFEEEFS